MRALALLCLMALATPVLAEEAELARARKIVAGSCFLCHGMQGESATELSPRLAAQNQDYIAKQLANFKSGERKSSAMRPMVASLTPQDMRALGLYCSRQKSEPHPTADARLAAQGMFVYRQGGKALFAWVNKDSFWRVNILSPGKLREKWDQPIQARRNQKPEISKKPKIDLDAIDAKYELERNGSCQTK